MAETYQIHSYPFRSSFMAKALEWIQQLKRTPANTVREGKNEQQRDASIFYHSDFQSLRDIDRIQYDDKNPQDEHNNGDHKHLCLPLGVIRQNRTNGGSHEQDDVVHFQ